MKYNELMDWKCPLCGGDVEMLAVAMVCLSCGVSLNPETHIPFKSDGKVVKAHEFGGGHVPQGVGK